ncbi:zinc finger protein 277 isoform X2 [Scyliorhinus canicula]|uniref:zinc finger protein 277 isoform X2 n=1 Tax=Scyliorhinus canicula TaxID=7830 RepID=UPI0018F6CFC3|nr:zinc finger protein 277 isoform X2 [Scyliorhinus canicula]
MAAVGMAAVEGKKDWILEPLSLPESPSCINDGFTLLPLPCIFCEDCYPVEEQEKLLGHMIVEHKLVIADVKLIVDFRRYILYWKKRFIEQPITDFCTVVRTNSQAPEGEQAEYYLLCDVLPEDRRLREQLQQKRLEEVLEQQQQERNDSSFARVCVFCNEEFAGNRAILFNHMAKDHSFNVGLPDNIVYCNEFLDLVQKKMDNLQCLYCEKTFRDKNTLKDHMRKKQHRRINAKNHEYDKFYTINYLELGKNWEEVQSEDDREMIEEQDDDWSDWQGPPVCAVCLFCEKAQDTTEKLQLHMKVAHHFDLLNLKYEMDHSSVLEMVTRNRFKEVERLRKKEEKGKSVIAKKEVIKYSSRIITHLLLKSLNFYQQVKLVNFIRREIHQCCCKQCGKTFSSKSEVVSHMTETNHIMSLLDRSGWDQPQYYFPTYENDALLCSLSDCESESVADNQKTNIPVIAEDISNLQALKNSSILNLLQHSDTKN